MPNMTVELAHLNVGSDPSHPTTMNTTLIGLINGQTMAADRVDRGWRKHQITVTKTGPKLMLQFTGFIGTSPQSRGQFVALDDISFTAGSCGTSAKTRFACVPHPKTKADYVPMTKVKFVYEFSKKLAIFKLFRDATLQKTVHQVQMKLTADTSVPLSPQTPPAIGL